MKGKPAKNKGVKYPHLRGEGNHTWIKGKLSYDTLHHWLYREFGKANKCENCHTPNAKRYEWALLKNKEYERKRENFWQLCTSCHHKYDNLRQKQWETLHGIQ